MCHKVKGGSRKEDSLKGRVRKERLELMDQMLTPKQSF
jgi:hypothetical protein